MNELARGLIDLALPNSGNAIHFWLSNKASFATA